MTELRSDRQNSRACGEQSLRIVVADSDGLARRMMETSIHQADRCAIVVGARDRREAVELARFYVPALMIVELALPPDGGTAVIRAVRHLLPDVRCLTVGSGASSDELALAALRAGALGHIDKDVEPTEFSRLVRLASSGEALVPRRLVGPLLALLHATPETGWRPLASRLTTREWQIVELLANGATTDRIAEILVVAAPTVYSHIRNLMRKLGVHSRFDAVRAAERLRHEEAVMRKTLVEVSTISPQEGRARGESGEHKRRWGD